MKRINAKGGFTLIELLVVIAIIGILSSIVLVSLNSARQKGKDARVISDVQQIRTALESGFNGTGYPDLNAIAACNAITAGDATAGNQVNGQTYAACANTAASPQHATLNQLNSDANNSGGNIFISTTGSAPNAYAIRGYLTSSAKYFCIDSTGATNAADDGINATLFARCH